MSLKEPRRANLATIVGSSLAVVAAGSLLAFSTLAEQAGLDGLATGRLQPAVPGRTGTGGHVITVPAPATAPPGDPREALAELVRESVRRAPVQEPPPEAVTPARPPSPDKPEPKRTPRVDDSPKVAVTEPPVEEDVAAEPDGPPYGHAYGHYKNKNEDRHEDPKPAKKQRPKSRSSEQPVYARTANEDGDSKPYKPSKPAKLEKVKKVKKAKSPGNGNGHGGHSNGKAKGHSKHAHKGKGKGHSKHGG
jgi:hypothetical protein